MSSLTIHKGSGVQPSAPFLPTDWDPFRRLGDVFRWDPFQEFVRFSPWEERTFGFVPPFEVKETKESYIFKADLPGIKEQDIDITLTGDVLTVGGKREMEQQDKGDKYYTYERSYGSFTRSFVLPDGANPEQVKAEVKEGVLTIVFQKRPEVQPKKIFVRPAEKVKA